MFDSVLRYLTFSIRWVDIVDLLLVYYLVYKILLFIKGSRAVQMLTGLIIVGIIYIMSMRLGLYTLHEMLSRFFSYLFIIIVILFQDDIRKALANVGRTPFMGKTTLQEENVSLVEEIVKTCVALTRKKIGALIVFERETGLKDFIEVGIKIDSKINAELLVSIFIPASPIHDGAVIVSEGKMIAAGCFLPLTRNPNVDKSLGTRHRAAIGITEETDSVVIVVSEEHREISMAIDGDLVKGLDGPALRSKLYEILGIKGAIGE
jgi:diadenylate cyclase